MPVCDHELEPLSDCCGARHTEYEGDRCAACLENTGWTLVCIHCCMTDEEIRSEYEQSCGAD